MNGKLFYLRQEVRARGSGRLTNLPDSAYEHVVVAHFYVVADNESDAGGYAGSFSVAHDLECVEYICLPQEVTRSHLGEHEDDHLVAFDLAEREGLAVVFTAALTWRTK